MRPASEEAPWNFATVLLKGGSHVSPKRVARPSPRGSTGASRLGEAHGESSRRIWSSVTRTLTVVPLPEGGGGPCKLTGDLRRGPVHPARRDLEPRVGHASRSSEAVSEETGCGGGYASTGVERVWLFELETGSEERGLSGFRRCRPSATGPHRSATWADPGGSGVSALARASCVSRHCRSRRVRDGPRSAERFDKRSVRQALVPTPGEPVFRSPEGSPKRGQAALPTAAGAWEARRATGYG